MTAPPPPIGLHILPVTGIGEVHPGDDLANLITTAAPWLAAGDVLVVTSKIVSKAEGCLVPVPASGPQREAARAAVLADQTARVVASRGATRIVQTRHGFVMASAGIDASNVDRNHLVLLPVDPDASARRLRACLRERHGLDVAVLISDTMGRPWRSGLTDVALGAAGLPPLRDYRGHLDAHGNELHLTQMAVVDEVCAAGELVKQKYDQIPVAVLRGLGIIGTPDGPGVAALIRPPEHDLFPLGTVEARDEGRAQGLTQAARPPEAADFASTQVPSDQLQQLLAAVDMPELLALPAVDRDRIRKHLDLAGSGVEFVVGYSQPTAAAGVTTGIALHRLRLLAQAAGLVSALLATEERFLLQEGAPPGRTAVAVLAVGHPA